MTLEQLHKNLSNGAQAAAVTAAACAFVALLLWIILEQRKKR